MTEDAGRFVFSLKSLKKTVLNPGKKQVYFLRKKKLFFGLTTGIPFSIITNVAESGTAKYGEKSPGDKSPAEVYGSIAQLGEHMPYKHGVTGSSPVVPTINGPVVQLVRTPACHAGGRRFEPVLGRQRHFSAVGTVSARYASVAQLVEQRTENPRVVGSIPTGGTTRSLIKY